MFYVMSDIHGCYNEFKFALSHWNTENETLIVLGDLIDRGPNSYNVIHTLRELQETYSDRVIVLKGNHDESFTEWLMDVPEEELGFYYLPSHNETIRSFYGHTSEKIQKFKRATRKQRGQHILYTAKKEIHFLANLPMYYETENCIFVHAGINLGLGDKWQLDKRCMNRTRNPFIYSKKKAPKRVFFGHTPTALIRDVPSNHDIWISDQSDKVGIDGGCAFGGQLNAMKINNNGDIVETIVIPKEEGWNT